MTVVIPLPPNVGVIGSFSLASVIAFLSLVLLALGQLAVRSYRRQGLSAHESGLAAVPMPLAERVRPATVADVDVVCELAGHFFDVFVKSLPGPVVENPAQMRALVRYCLNEGGVWLGERRAAADGPDDAWVSVGFIGVLAVPHPISGVVTAVELAWWLDVEARGGKLGRWLHDEAEAWARGKGCSMIKMVAPHGSSVGSYYARRGYVPVETEWYKALRS